jgi:NAD(P)H-dependent FMN reductase
MMKTVFGLAGSLREGSYNAALLREAAQVAPSGLRIEIASIRGIPLYDADVEVRDGIPAVVTELKDRIAASDGLLLATPEYNHSIPGVFKNAIDWLSRPPKDIARVFGGRKVGLIGASPGRFGTMLAQAAWLPVLRTLGTEPWFGKALHVSAAGSAFDASGLLTDDTVRTLLEGYMRGFAEHLGV